MSITIKEIADKTNTSIATVSRVMNTPEIVAEKTRKKILAVMEKHNYRQNQLARGLVKGKSQTIALVTPDEKEFLDAYYFKELFLGINKGANGKGYSILINQQDLNIHFPVDGYILVSPFIGNPLVKNLELATTPSILIGCKSNKLNWVDINNISATVEIVNHLIKLGHKHIGIITGGKNVQNSVERVRGYKKALKENNIEFNPEYVINGAFSEKRAYEQVNKLISKKLSITALMACNDLMAVGAIRAIKANNMKTPEDIAVVGFDDIAEISFFDPAITTFKQPLFNMGLTAVNLLVDRIEGKTQELVNKEFKGRLILRESCGIQLKQ